MATVTIREIFGREPQMLPHELALGVMLTAIAEQSRLAINFDVYIEAYRGSFRVGAFSPDASKAIALDPRFQHLANVLIDATSEFICDGSPPSKKGLCQSFPLIARWAAGFLEDKIN